jgi:hypothetical protein
VCSIVALAAKEDKIGHPIRASLTPWHDVVDIERHVRARGATVGTLASISNVDGFSRFLVHFDHLGRKGEAQLPILVALGPQRARNPLTRFDLPRLLGGTDKTVLDRTVCDFLYTTVDLVGNERRMGDLLRGYLNREG